jgi:hypothetical protein
MAIIFNPSLDIWAIPHLSDRDCQVAIWYLNKRLTILVSAYWEINSPNIPDKITQAISYAKRGKYDFLMGIDSNDHHCLWGSPTNNPRGLRFEEFISMHNLNLLNNSQAPTFVKGLHKTHMDLILTSPRLAQLIQTWEVLPDSASPLPHQCHAQATPTNLTDWITPQLVQSTIKSFKSDKDKGESFKTFQNKFICF